MNLNAYPKIFSVGDKYISHLFEDPVEITEKIDGSQFVFGKIDGDLCFRSKGAIIYRESPQNMFESGVRYIESIEDRLPDNTIFYGEYLNRPKHNVLTYNSVPKNGITLFGMSSLTKEFMSYPHLASWAKILDIDIVPKLYEGRVENVEQIHELLQKESFLGGPKIEGVVIKNYHKSYMIGGRVIPITAGKYVSEKFKELHNKNWKKESTPRGKWDVYKSQFCTEARWWKAVQHLRDKGELEHSPKDIGKLIKEVRKDIVEEEKENIKDFLWKEFSEELLRASIKGLPEWYKEKIMEEMFNEML